MATLSPIRQPFGVLDGARLRNLGNLKNVQNSIVDTKSLKRSHDHTLDTENVDPEMFSPSKKSKGFPSKPHFTLQQSSTPSFTNRRILKPRKMKMAESSKPISFSAPAGRSPKSKRVGIFSKRTSFGRVDPPAFSLNNTAPFSIDAALSGTVPTYKTPEPNNVVPDLNDAVPKGWMFEIHEDTPDEELGNLVQHSTQTLNISDDAKAIEELGKENIPPQLLASPVRRDVTDVRTPLGDLDPTEFYAEGCDANSYIFVEEDDVKDKVIDEEATLPLSPVEPLSPTPIPADADINNEVWKALLAHAGDSEPAPIEIWESESAKGDTEQEKEVVATTTTLQECMAAVEAREEQALASST